MLTPDQVRQVLRELLAPHALGSTTAVVEDRTGLLGRGVAERGLVRQAGTDGVGTHYVHQRHGMGRRLHATHVEFVQLGDVAEHLAKLGAKLLLLFGAELQPGQVRHVFHFFPGDLHGRVPLQDQTAKTPRGFRRARFPPDQR